jgi:phosphopantetheinyl transferase
MNFLPLDEACFLEGRVTAFPTEDSPGDAGIEGSVVLSPEGALAELRMSEERDSSPSSRFLNPVLYLTQVWGERFGVTGLVIRAVEESPGSWQADARQRYVCRLLTGEVSNRLFSAEAFIYTAEGKRAAHLNIVFDTAGDRQAFVDRREDSVLDALQRVCSGHCLIEHDYLLPLARYALTPAEQRIAAGLTERRKRSFTAARLSLKRLARKIGLTDRETEPSALETVDEKDRRPILPGTDGKFFASVSHDKHFTLSVVDRRPIGVDIEALSVRLARASHIFMCRDELAIATGSNLCFTQASAMVWTAKEAAAKCLNMHLIDAWRAVRLIRIGAEQSILRYAGGELPAVHLFAWGRVISIVSASAGVQSTDSI